MGMVRSMYRRRFWIVVSAALMAAPVAQSFAQEADPLPAKTDTANKFANTFNGEFAPGSGYTLIKTQRGSLNISVYGLFRYMNQYARWLVHRPPRPHAHGEPRNDLNWHRTFVWLTGFFYDPKLRYNISLWSLPTTQQTLLFGNLQYRASPAFVVRRRDLAQSHGALRSGIVALLGGDGSTDGRGILPRRIFVRASS